MKLFSFVDFLLSEIYCSLRICLVLALIEFVEMKKFLVENCRFCYCMFDHRFENEHIHRITIMLSVFGFAKFNLKEIIESEIE